MSVQLGGVRQHGFNEPLGLLSDCHRRIEYFLSVLRVVVERAGEGALSDEHRGAVETALTYFSTAAPRHNEDEERSLFPLLFNSQRASVREAFASIESLEDDHAAAEPMHGLVDGLYRQWLEAGSLSAGQREQLRKVMDDLSELYRGHIEIEDKKIFPLAAEALSAEQLARVGSEMAERRGIRAVVFSKSEREFAVTTKYTIDVRTIPRPQRHPLIFKTFESLEAGEALEIVNDHDPFPLHNQFKMLKKDQFSWEYLQQGPELWRVQIARVAAV